MKKWIVAIICAVTLIAGVSYGVEMLEPTPASADPNPGH